MGDDHYDLSFQLIAVLWILVNFLLFIVIKKNCFVCKQKAAPGVRQFDSIESVVTYYEQIICRLKKLATDATLKKYHRVDATSFRKLIEWVNFKEGNIKVLEDAWTDPCFWPFLETMEAAKLVQDDPSQLVIRLSNTHPGTITATRLGKVKVYLCFVFLLFLLCGMKYQAMHGKGKYKRFEAQVKHKRYVVNNEGTLLLMNENDNQEVSWQGLIRYLLVCECNICLQEIHNAMDNTMLPCKHCFHKFLPSPYKKKKKKEKEKKRKAYAHKIKT
ncbi:hypothetical protein RFI_14373 [Reticulomyxa filosa]|uniref:Uncharacterized protein n=1 Tax=Reticulomyxa filosa TaxID=46433 RepID=X6NAM5_RETFI|nr:hypothetical protein RFI_14373 [Reticulomyxa filosa]|eukprot:ETO22819.1 hypothetical protein RFI_14373 [Reticulomyxa filosa]